MADLSVELSGLRLRNPTVLASGILDETGASMHRAVREGAGAVVTKSVGTAPRTGNPNPTLVEVEGGMLNAIGLANPGIDNYRPEIEEAKRGGAPVIASVFGSSAEEFAVLSRKMESYGADGIELNLSCPHAEGFGTEIGARPEAVESIVRAVRAAVAIPLFAKLTPNTDSIAALAKAAERGGAHGITAINTVRGMTIEVELQRPVLAHGLGGLSGAAIRPVGVACVYQIARATRLPIMGCGGIAAGRDAIEYLMAGATAVQIGTAVTTGGPGIFRQVASEIDRFLDAHRVASVREVVGRAHAGI